MPTTRVNGTKPTYEEIGEGEPLIFVHGSASDHRSWEFQKEAFAERFRVITYSRRYHWLNEPIPEEEEYSMDEQVEDLQALIRSLDATPAHLVGNSYGAFLSLLLAARGSPPLCAVWCWPSPRSLHYSSVMIRSRWSFSSCCSRVPVLPLAS